MPGKIQHTKQVYKAMGVGATDMETLNLLEILDQTQIVRRV